MTLSGKQILITGATGYIGGQLARRLAGPEVSLRALVRNPDKAQALAALGIEICQGDVTQPRTVEAAMAGCQIVFHAAAWVSERGPRREVWAVNVGGTRHMINAALAHGVDRFVQVSSCAVYGSLQRHNIDERTPVRWRGSLYGRSKAAAERVVMRAYRRYGLPIVVARASQVYGPGSYQFTVRPVELIKSGKMVLVDGGRHLCKPVYIDNLIDGLLLCATVDEAIGEAINLTDGTAIPWRYFFGAYGRMLNIASFPSVPYPLAWLAGGLHEIKGVVRRQPSSLNRRVVKALRSSNSFSNRKAAEILGWLPRVDFSEGMRRTEAWLQDEGYFQP